MTIDAPRQIPDLKELWQQAFEDSPAFIDSFFRTGFSPERCRCLYVDDTLAAALYWFDCLWKGKKLAYVYAVATDETFRGQGLCRRLMEDIHRHLQSAGYAGVLLVPGEPGLFRLYEKLGYIPCCPMQTVTVLAGTAPVAVRPISASAYTVARKKHLPADAVWQDEAALAYAQTFMDFYEGPGSAFCGAVEESVFKFQEFIGDMEDVPGIVRHFCCESGVVSFPGKRHRAMYHALDGSPELPTYFGIPLN